MKVHIQLQLHRNKAIYDRVAFRIFQEGLYIKKLMHPLLSPSLKNGLRIRYDCDQTFLLADPLWSKHSC